MVDERDLNNARLREGEDRTPLFWRSLIEAIQNAVAIEINANKTQIELHRANESRVRPTEIRF